MEYCITDIETTGGRFSNRVTEISILVFDGKKIIDEFYALVNPKTPIEPSVQRLTGISNAMVANEPAFDQIANHILNITQDRIFVAHNVQFDYGVLKNEFELLHINFQRQRLCTVRLSRKLIPEANGYALHKICGFSNIVIENRHRAKGDAEATVKLFKILLERDKNKDIENLIKKSNKELKLPPNISLQDFNDLPEKTGVYRFHDENNKVIYVGKAKSIKNRVESHFRTKSGKKLMMIREIHKITYELTGNELLALLRESNQIQEYYPKYNISQKFTFQKYALQTYFDQKGRIKLVINQKKLVSNPIIEFDSLVEGREYIHFLTKQFKLCPFLNTLKNQESCLEYDCPKVCAGQQSVQDYNQLVFEALKQEKADNSSYIIQEKGRNINELAYVFVENGYYIGYGFHNMCSENRVNFQELLIRDKSNKHLQKILHFWLFKNKVVKINLDKSAFEW